MSDPIRILCASDLHFGHPGLDQEDMAIAFVDTVFPLLADSDIFCINGDFFDRLVNFNNHGFDPIYEVIINLMRWCDQHRVILRVLQGTFEHDLHQIKRWLPFYRSQGVSFDFRYVEGIDLEEITVRDRTLRFLFVQDNLPFTSSDDIVEQIHIKLQEKGWDEVDYACMHGFFDFTWPKNVPQDNVVVFNQKQFPFVKKMIDVGHVHQHRIVGDVVSNGSFDRLNHGDEDPKGCVRIFDYPDHYTAQFIENKKAAIFHSVLVDPKWSTEDIITHVNGYLASVQSSRKIALRFVTEKAEQRDAIKVWMRETHPDIAISSKTVGEKEQGSIFLSSNTLVTPTEKKVAPTPQTLASFVRADMPESYVLSTDEIEHYLFRHQR